MASREITVKLADLPQIAAVVDQLKAAITRVQAVHARNTRFPYYCLNCRSEWPCKTIRALGSP